MAMIQCRYGHHYDDNRYLECPICAREKQQGKGLSDRDSQKTVGQAFRLRRQPEHETVWLNRTMPDDDGKTVGKYSGIRGNNYVTGWLVCVNGPERGRDYAVRYGYNNLGRGSGMDIYISADQEIAREGHCSVVYDPEHNQFFLLPLKGNLVYMNGRVLEGVRPLHDRDRFQVGNSEFEFIAFCKEGHKWEKEENGRKP